MEFWPLAYQWGWVTAEQLKLIVITDTMLFGDITPEQYKEITGQDFE